MACVNHVLLVNGMHQSCFGLVIGFVIGLVNDRCQSCFVGSVNSMCQSCIVGLVNGK